MAIKQIDPSLLEFDTTEESLPQQNQEQNPGYLQQAGQLVKGLGVQAALAPLRIAEFPARVGKYGAEKLGVIPESNIRFPSERIEEYLDPESKNAGVIGKALRYTAGATPLLAEEGALSALNLGRDFLSSLAIAGTQEAGFGPGTQIAASILTSKGFDKVVNRGKTSKLGLFKEGLYEKEKQVGSKIPVKDNSLVDKIDDIYKKTQKKLVSDYGFTQANKSSVLSNLDEIKDRLKNQSITASDLFEINKDLNSIWSPNKSISKGIYDHTKSLIQNSLNDIYKEHPSYASSAKGANELHAIENWQSGLGRWASQLDASGKFNKIMTGLGSSAVGLLLRGSTGALAGAGLTGAGYLGIKGIQGIDKGGRAAQFIQSLSKTKDGQKLMWDIVADSAKGSMADITKDMIKFNKKAEEYEESQGNINPIDPNLLEIA